VNIIEHQDPNFIATETFSMNTSKGEIIIVEGEPMRLSVDTEGNVIYGSDGDIFKIIHKTGLTDLLSRVRPVDDFTLKVEEDSEMSLVATLKEGELTKSDILRLVPFLDKSLSHATEILSIRSTEI